MSYLARLSFVTKMVVPVESKIFMSDRDHFAAFMSGARRGPWRLFLQSRV